MPASAEDGISKFALSTIDRMDRKSQLFFLAIFAIAIDSISTASALVAFRNFDFSIGQTAGFSVEVIRPKIGLNGLSSLLIRSPKSLVNSSVWSEIVVTC